MIVNSSGYTYRGCPLFLFEECMITFNGTPLENAAGKNLSTLIQEAGYDKARVAVEVDMKIIPKKEWEDFIVPDECTIEVVSFVGGG